MAGTKKVQSEATSYQCDMTRHADFVEFQVRGVNSEETVAAYLSEVHRRAISEGARRVLIEEHLEGPGLGIGGIFDIVAEASYSFDPPLTRIAYIDRSEDRDPEKLDFAETIARNRGIPARFFASREAAIRWLRS